ncbi:GNAT family N-acetyltransferase [Planomicrobium sp. YIM 101495]|uniref:GNAT family N-acetyltransferase n=1 Tax=Planomicrobium sp. YIM 101495 TaxID=2665160 RepID=UPI0012B7E6E9|nr:GNAT family N-acetyltransferase [Planomicrobium sp. YIM 101495]MTD31348.1 GNAT family N-acetyltransferase [Planomicrobium sp. YIM 101495]
MTIRKMVHKDLDIMTKWLNTEEVLEFFGDPAAPPSAAQVRAKYGPRIDGAVAVEPYIVEAEGRPFAFMQCYRLTEEDYARYGYSSDELIYGMDQFIGEPDVLNRGYGTRMVKAFAELIFTEKRADAIVMDPEVRNLRAIRCYEKCGFRKLKEIDEGTKWLMELRREKFSGKEAAPRS